MMTTAAALVALAKGPPGLLRIGAERTYPPFSELSPVWRVARPLAYGRLNAVVAQTEQAAVWLRTRTLARRIEVINNPLIEGGRAGPVVDPGVLPGEARVLLAVGRLSAEKQYEALIGAFDRLASSRPDWRLVILGEGPQRDLLEQRRGAAVHGDRVHLLGRVANVDEWSARAQLFVMSSRFEGFPNACWRPTVPGRLAFRSIASPDLRRSCDMARMACSSRRTISPPWGRRWDG
jgi:glycosyltransferase involved in cell wall biosynthesis